MNTAKYPIAVLHVRKRVQVGNIPKIAIHVKPARVSIVLFGKVAQSENVRRRKKSSPVHTAMSMKDVTIRYGKNIPC
jgi:hypothetical protein